MILQFLNGPSRAPAQSLLGSLQKRHGGVLLGLIPEVHAARLEDVTGLEQGVVVFLVGGRQTDDVAHAVDDHAFRVLARAVRPESETGQFRVVDGEDDASEVVVLHAGHLGAVRIQKFGPGFDRVRWCCQRVRGDEGWRVLRAGGDGGYRGRG